MNGIKTKKSVQLIGFGSFSVARLAPGRGVNPKIHATIQIPASKTAKFKVGSKVKNQSPSNFSRFHRKINIGYVMKKCE
jgi:nucleoid DNA-binding protein